MTEILDINKEEKAEPPKELVWAIKFSLENGGISVDGPINDELLSLGIIEKAKDIIKAHNLQRAIQNQPKIHKPGIMDFVRKGH